MLLPLMLLANFAVFQYLVLLFHKRWREPYVMLLLCTATLGWVSLVPFASVDDERLRSMNDVSEGSLALLLLVQTALVGTPKPLSGAAHVAKSADSVLENSSSHDKHAPATRTLATLMTRCGQLIANMLIAIEVVLLLLSVGLIIYELLLDHEYHLETINNARENITLAFTFFYRTALLARDKNMDGDAFYTTNGWKYCSTSSSRLTNTPYATGEHNWNVVGVRAGAIHATHSLALQLDDYWRAPLSRSPFISSDSPSSLPSQSTCNVNQYYTTYIDHEFDQGPR